MLSHFDDCAGIGGFALAAKLCGGIQTRWAREIDTYARAVYAKHFPEVLLFKDVREPLSAIGDCDLYTAGFPCQPFSRAGKRLGAGDERNLWPWVRDTIAFLRPTWVLCENTPGVDEYLETVCGPDLATLGYEWLPLGIPACALGAWHERQRIWIVAHAESQRGRKEPWTEGEKSHLTGEAISDANVLGQVLGCAQQNRGAEPQHIVCATALPDTERPERWSQREARNEGWRDILPSGEESAGGLRGGSWWDAEPDVGRVAHGVPARVDRLRCLGNAIVPQVAAWVMRRIVEASQSP